MLKFFQIQMMIQKVNIFQNFQQNVHDYFQLWLRFSKFLKLSVKLLQQLELFFAVWDVQQFRNFFSIFNDIVANDHWLSLLIVILHQSVLKVLNDGLELSVLKNGFRVIFIDVQKRL